MTGTEVALIITASATLVTSLGGFVVLLRKVEVIQKATNGLASRNEAIAQKLGVAEGKAQGLEQGREEQKK